MAKLILTPIFWVGFYFALSAQNLGDMLFFEGWNESSGAVMGSGVDWNGDPVDWDIFKVGGNISYGGDLNINNTDEDPATWSVSSIEYGICAEAEISFDISHSDDIESECNIVTDPMSCLNCDAALSPMGVFSADWVDVFINGNQYEEGGSTDLLGCSTFNCDMPMTNCTPDFCDINAGGHNLYGDCNGGTISKAGDFGSHSFFETVTNPNDGSTISIEITIVSTAVAEEFSVGPVSVECVVLSVELSSFQVQKLEEGVLVEWQTATEINNDFFMIERSTNGIDYVSIGETKGAGTSFLQQEYSFIDRAPQIGSNYYRIKQYDFDGQMSLSDVKVVEIEDASTISELWIYPNPADGFINISLYPDGNSRARIEIIDMKGQIVQSISDIKDTTNPFTLNTDHLTSGSYIVRSQQGSTVRVGHFMKD